MSTQAVERHEGLPEAERPEGLCPRCRKQSAFHVVAGTPLSGDGNVVVGKSEEGTLAFVERASVLICMNCRRGVVVVERREFGKKVPGLGGVPIHWRGIHWWPSVGAAVHPAVPVSIRLALEEAESTFNIACYRSASIMARHALEAVTKEQGATKYSLVDRLKELASAHKLQPNLAEWATEVRLVGNAGAHDPLSDVPKEDAQDLIQFMHALVEYLYVLPFELRERRKNRAQK